MDELNALASVNIPGGPEGGEPQDVETSLDRSSMLATDLLGTALLGLAQAGTDEQAARKYLTRYLAQTFVRVVTLLRPSLVLEIGAHEAAFSRRIKRRLPEARVVAFEANPLVCSTYATPCANLGIEYIELCLGDRTTESLFRVPIVDGKPGLTQGSLLEDFTFAEANFYDLAVRPIDDFLGHAAALPNALWVDVEGALANVLGGATNTLGACQALYAELETSRRWSNQRIDAEIVPMLREQGLHLVLRDYAKPFQYNGLFLRKTAMANPAIANICRRFILSLTKRDGQSGHDSSADPQGEACAEGDASLVSEDALR